MTLVNLKTRPTDFFFIVLTQHRGLNIEKKKREHLVFSSTKSYNTQRSMWGPRPNI